MSLATKHARIYYEFLLYTGHPVEIQPTNRSSPWFRLGKWGQSLEISSEAHSW